jgi:hypothetical protein
MLKTGITEAVHTIRNATITLLKRLQRKEVQ